LLRDGVEVGESPFAASGSFPIPESAGTYTLRATAIRELPWSSIGTRADVEWKFQEPGAGGPAEPLPLLVVKARGQVDDQNRAPAGKLFPLVLTAQSQPGLPAPKLNLLGAEASFDDGQTWRSLPVIFDRDTGLTILRHPAGPGFVSLRIKARDKAGNEVTQTVRRAYQIG
jgi:hypothetical protein